MSHIHNGQIYLRTQVFIKQNKNCHISVNKLRRKCWFLPEPKPQSTQRDQQPKSAPYFSREETNTFRLTPIILPSSKTWRWNKNRDLLLRSARGNHSLIHWRKSSFNAVMAAGVTKKRVTWKDSCRRKTITFSLVKTERLSYSDSEALGIGFYCCYLQIFN